METFDDFSMLLFFGEFSWNYDNTVIIKYFGLIVVFLLLIWLQFQNKYVMYFPEIKVINLTFMSFFS